MEGRAEATCNSALERLAADREDFAREACGNDEVLHARVRELLAAEKGTEALGTRGGAPSSSLESEFARLKPEEAGDRIGPYKLLQPIGEGGFGVVWMAEQEHPVRRKVALKVIKLGMDTKEVIARFEQERHALALMDHPSIARVLDAGATQFGRPYFVMELVRGVKITEYCDDQGLSTTERIQLFIAVCQAVQHAHQKGIIHRDLKPSNILVTINDNEAVPKVIDFGVAKATAGRLTDGTLFTQFEQMIGTPLYMSPEQAENTSLDIDTRSDIYALGVLLYELLTGRTPIDTMMMAQAGMDEIRRIIREVDPPRPSMRLKTLDGKELTTIAKRRHMDAAKLPNSLRGDLDWIVMKCLEKDRRRRYETANGLAADLRRHLDNEPVVARPPSAAYRFHKAWRRNRLAFSAAVTVTAALVAGIGISLWQAIRATHAEREQSQLREIAVKALAGEKEQRTQAESEQRRADDQARKATESQQHSHQLLYAADMNLAQQSLKQNNLGKARRLLDRYQQPGEGDLRGWEWRYLWQQTRSNALVTLTHRPVRVFSLSFSPDGTRLAVGWFDGRVDLWDVPGRRQIRTLTDLQNLPPGRVAFSPVGNLLAATAEQKTVSLYDLDSGREWTLWRASDAHVRDVRDLAFSKDGSKLVIYVALTVGRNEIGDEVWVIDVASSKVEMRQQCIYSGDNHFGSGQLSPDNRHLYLSRSDYERYRYSIQCFDVATGEQVWQTGEERDQGLTTLAVSPDGRVLASGSGYEDPTIRIWDTTNGRLLIRLDGHTAWVAKLVFSRDGRQLVSAASDQTIRLWDTSTWTETRVLRGHADELHAVSISEPAQLVASGSKDGDLMLWKEDGNQTADYYRRFPEETADYRAYMMDQARVLWLAPDKPAMMTDLKKDSSLNPVPELEPTANLLSPFEANRFFRWNGSNQILFEELRGNHCIPRGAVTLNSNARPTAFASNAKRQFVAWSAGSSPKSIYVASLATPDRRVELNNDMPGVSSLLFSPDGTYLCAAFNRRSVRVWIVDTGQLVFSLNDRGLIPMFSEDHQPFILTVEQTTGHEIRFYDLAHAGKLQSQFLAKHFASAMVLSPDRKLLASATGGGQVRLFDTAKGEFIESLHGHLNAIFGIGFSKDGQRLITSSGGREAVKLWDFSTRQELLTLSGAGSTVTTARWSADENAILAGPPWQAWLAPTWEEITAAEEREKANPPQL